MDFNEMRRRVVNALRQAGIENLEIEWESPLVADGHFFGGRFEFAGLRAYCFRSRPVVEVYDSESWRLLLTVPLDASTAAKVA